MQMARSGLAVAAGFVVFSILFTVIGPSLGAILTTAAAGLMAGYLTAAAVREMFSGDVPVPAVPVGCRSTGRPSDC